jgi:hypothetical protein
VGVLDQPSTRLDEALLERLVSDQLSIRRGSTSRRLRCWQWRQLDMGNLPLTVFGVTLQDWLLTIGACWVSWPGTQL